VAASRPIRLLVVDDSPTVRAVLRRVFGRAPDIEIVGEATNGEEAIEAAVALHPQVVLMDIEMPGMDGYTATQRIMGIRPVPIVIVTSRANRDQAGTAFEALKHGALDVFAKPERVEDWDELAKNLPEAVRNLARGVRPPGPRGVTVASPGAGGAQPAGTRVAVHVSRRDIRYVAVGASTGGPAAVRKLLAGLPSDAPATILVVQHIAPGFEIGFAEWLARELDRDVQVARQGEEARPATVRVAASHAHLRLARNGLLQVDHGTPPRGGHRPSVDELFLSCAQSDPKRTVGVLLTGMGNDGAEGLAALRAAGGLTFVQDELSSVVFGMPRAALERGAAEFAVPPEELARILSEIWAGEGG
jgi:two-component system chemotaxis response regulator CheB